MFTTLLFPLMSSARLLVCILAQIAWRLLFCYSEFSKIAKIALCLEFHYHLSATLLLCIKALIALRMLFCYYQGTESSDFSLISDFFPSPRTFLEISVNLKRNIFRGWGGYRYWGKNDPKSIGMHHLRPSNSKIFWGGPPHPPAKNHTLDSSFNYLHASPTELCITRFSDFFAKTHSDPCNFRSAPSTFPANGPPIGVRFQESLVVRLHSGIGQIHLSIEAQCVTTLLSLGDCHTQRAYMPQFLSQCQASVINVVLLNVSC